MTRFALLQSRTQVLGAMVAVAVLVVVAALTGPYLGHLYATTVASCRARGDCAAAVAAFGPHDGFLRAALPLLMLVVPAVLGIFWGAPLLARELETGTFRLAWTQSVTRSRWLRDKLVVVSVATIVVAGVTSLTATWWLRADDLLDAHRFTPPDFDARALVVVAYAVFAVILGALAGAVIRRTLPAMVATLVTFIGVRLAVALWVRPHFAAPLRMTIPLRLASSFGFMKGAGSAATFEVHGTTIANAWVYSTHLVTYSGQVATAAERARFVRQYCPRLAQPPPVSAPGQHIQAVPDGAFKACIDKASTKFHLLVTYQPANRYWTFQWYETALFLVLALALAGVCFWWVRRRIA
jgi:hypothetical protein